MMALYVFDANVWIDLGRHQPPDIYVNLWKLIDAAIADGTIRSPEEVLIELQVGADNLAATLKQREGLFVPPDEAVQLAIQEITDNCDGFVDPDGDRDRGDPFVVALAKERGGVVVTKERPRRGPTGRPRIPDACAQFEVPCLHWFDFLKVIGWQL